MATGAGCPAPPRPPRREAPDPSRRRRPAGRGLSGRTPRSRPRRGQDGPRRDQGSKCHPRALTPPRPLRTRRRRLAPGLHVSSPGPCLLGRGGPWTRPARRAAVRGLGAHASGAPDRDVTPEGPVSPGPGRAGAPRALGPFPARSRGLRTGPGADARVGAPRRPPARPISPTHGPHRPRRPASHAVPHARPRVPHAQVGSPPPTPGALTKLPSRPGAGRVSPRVPTPRAAALRAPAHTQPRATRAPRRSRPHATHRPRGGPPVTSRTPTPHKAVTPRTPTSRPAARSAPEPASVPHPASAPDASRRPHPGSAPRSPRAPALRAHLGARAHSGVLGLALRLRGPQARAAMGVRARRPGRPAARQEGGWAAAPPPRAGARAAGRAACSARLSPSPPPRSPTRLSEPSRGGGGARGRGEPAARGAGPGRAPGRACLVSAGAAGKCDPLRTGRASGRAAGDARGEKESESGRKKLPGRPGCARSRPRAPGQAPTLAPPSAVTVTSSLQGGKHF
ncbi:basic proline-rich protein-like [Leopardus geoffroyi]|uniref:basic proline-rich protein-like n=1 Tax=Leopardus geoffroyi TaxID=46844 RepID=UPI001E260098|nr:basic proline-rich protein-like [Leopardus geoffroyi]